MIGDRIKGDNQKRKQPQYIVENYTALPGLSSEWVKPGVACMGASKYNKPLLITAKTRKIRTEEIDFPPIFSVRILRARMLVNKRYKNSILLNIRT